MSFKAYLTTILVAFALSASAQTVTFPYNPDGNADQYISITDLRDPLIAYGQPWTPQELAVDSIPLSAVFWTKPSYVSQANTTASTSVSPRMTATSTVLEFPAHSVRCLRAVPQLGCTNANFMEYDPAANVDDGSCTELIGCEDGATLTYQGFEYNLVTIGEQCWFVQNLEATFYGNGDAIQNLQNRSEWAAANVGSVGAWCDYSNNDSDTHAFGKLYNWYAVNDSRALCPNEWHVPSDSEWTQLIHFFLGGATYAGMPMKASPDDSPGWNGTNHSGFTGLPGGYRETNGSFYYAGSMGGWWSSSPSGSRAWSRYLGNDNENVGRYHNDPRGGLSVRCVRDAE